jgi:DNA-directed RNA polymerase specialized sigma24 family protein
MNETTELNDPNENMPPAHMSAGGDTDSRVGLVPPLANGQRRPEVEGELGRWYALQAPERLLSLREAVTGRCAFSLEALVHVSRQAFVNGDRKTLNLAFEALTMAAAPLLLGQAYGQVADERMEQVQEVLLQTFQAISDGNADFAEQCFAGFAKKKAISLYRARRARFEGASLRIEPYDEVDPMDDVPARLPSGETLAIFACSLDKLSPKHRAAFIQFYHWGFTQEEIAQQHRVDVRTIRNWLKAASATVWLSGGEDDR